MTASPGRAPTLFEPDRERFGEGAVLLRRWVDDDVQREYDRTVTDFKKKYPILDTEAVAQRFPDPVN